MKVDWRKENPKLHMLYTKWAVNHLSIIRRQIQELSDLCNINMLDIISAMQTEHDKLIAENAAYADAAEILDGIVRNL